MFGVNFQEPALEVLGIKSPYNIVQEEKGKSP